MVRLVRYANCTYFLLLMLIDTRRERISLHLLWKFGPSINTTAQYNKIKHSCTRTHFLSKREFACLYYPICVREYVLLVINSFAAYDRMMYLTLMRQIHQVQNDYITKSRLEYTFFLITAKKLLVFLPSIYYILPYVRFIFDNRVNLGLVTFVLQGEEKYELPSFRYNKLIVKGRYDISLSHQSVKA